MLLVLAVFQFQLELHHATLLNIGMETHADPNLKDTFVLLAVDGMEMFVLNIQPPQFAIQDIITMVEVALVLLLK